MVGLDLGSQGAVGSLAGSELSHGCTRGMSKAREACQASGTQVHSQGG